MFERLVINSFLRKTGTPQNVANTFVEAFPAPIEVVYPYGKIIRVLTKTGAGSWNNLKGGVGNDFYSEQFQPAAKGNVPTVTVQIFFRDYYAGEISVLRNQCNELTNRVTVLTNEKGDINRKIVAISAEKLRLNQDKNRATALIQEATSEIENIEQQILTEKAKLEKAQADLKTLSFSTLSLFQFLSLVPSMGFSIATNLIQQFQQLYAKYSTLFDSKATGENILSSFCAAFLEIKKRLPVQDIVEADVIFGATGAGKSVFVNGMTKRALVKNPDGTIDVDPKETPVSKIGHKLITSETLYTEVCREEKIYLDAGGFFDTRGLVRDFTVSLSLSQTLTKVKNARWIFCFEAALLSATRSKDLFEQLKIVFAFLPITKELENSFFFLVTKPTDYGEEGHLTKEDVVIYLNKLLPKLTNPSEKEAVAFLIRKEGSYIATYEPIQVPLLPFPNEFIYQKLTPNSYSLPLTNDTRQAATAAIEGITSQVTPLLEQVDTLTKKIADLTEKLQKEKTKKVTDDTKLNNIQTSLNALANEELLKQEVTKRQAEITSLQQQIETKKKEIKEKDSDTYITYIYQDKKWKIV